MNYKEYRPVFLWPSTGETAIGGSTWTPNLLREAINVNGRVYMECAIRVWPPVVKLDDSDRLDKIIDKYTKETE